MLGRCEALPWRSLLQLYGDLATESPEHSTWAAIALRDKARKGELPETTIPILALCLRDAAAGGAIVNLAKALAAFGRDASIATPFLIGQLRAHHVIDDESFWSFDGCLYSLGYLGGPEAGTFLDELEVLPLAPVLRAGKLYQGELTAEERAGMFGRAMKRVARMLSSDPGRWTGRATKLEVKNLGPKEKAGLIEARGATAKQSSRAKQKRGLV